MRINPLQDRSQPINCQAVHNRHRIWSQKDRIESCLTGSQHIPLWMISNECGLACLDAEELKSFFEWGWMRLAPADIYAKHYCIDDIV